MTRGDWGAGDRTKPFRVNCKYFTSTRYFAVFKNDVRAQKSLHVTCYHHIAVDQSGNKTVTCGKNLLKISDKLPSAVGTRIAFNAGELRLRNESHRIESAVGRRKQWVKTAVRVHGREAISGGSWPTDSSM